MKTQLLVTSRKICREIITRVKARLVLACLIVIFTSTYALKPTKFEIKEKTTQTSLAKIIASKVETRHNKKGVNRKLNSLAAGPVLDVSTTLIGINCNKQATYEVKICNNGDQVATGVMPNLIPENAGFVLKSVSPDIGYSIFSTGYSDPGGDTPTQGYDGYAFAAISPCPNNTYTSPCINSFAYGTFSTRLVSNGVFSFPPTTAGSGVPQDAIVLSAKLNVRINATGHVGGIKRTDISIFGGANHPGDLYFSYPTSSSIPSLTTEMDVTAIAQELVKQPGWTNNSTMAYFWAGTMVILNNPTERVSTLAVSYIEPATIEPGACATLTYVYDVSGAQPGTYQMSANVSTATPGTTFLPDTDFSVSGLNNQNGYDGTALTNTTDDTVIPESYLPVLSWSCPGSVMSGNNIIVAATTSNASSVVLSSATSGMITNTGTAEVPAAVYTPTSQDITNGYATITMLSTSPYGCETTTSCQITINPSLPVTLIDFSAAKNENNVLLRWKTASETNSKSFEIERSKNGKVWNTIGTVSAHFESATIQNYHFTDLHPEIGSGLYRLKMIDMDNTFSYSRIQEVKGEKILDISVYPNPVSDELIVSSNLSSISEIKLIDLKGSHVYPASLVGKSIPVKKYPDGIYLLVIRYKSGETETRKVLIRH